MKSAWFKIVLAFLHTLKAFICLILIFTGDEIINFPLYLHAVAFNMRIAETIPTTYDFIEKILVKFKRTAPKWNRIVIQTPPNWPMEKY